ncbi:hypothetical protein F183_A28360 [Bryobacterales bacterium F-183]|nr:hypothetical protein F183_A28360 [Bryobacterales bacterium F-183]
MPLATTILRELFTRRGFDRVPEPDLVMDSADAVAAFRRAAGPGGILSGVYAFYLEQASRMLRPGDRVLDLGCGPAVLLSSLARLHPGVQFVGVDLSDGMLQASQGTTPANVSVLLDDMCTLSTVDTGSVDVVLSSMALHHLPDAGHLRQCFAAIHRVLRKDGRVFVSDFGRLRNRKSIGYFVRRAIPPGEDVLARDYAASLTAAFSLDDFRAALRDSQLGSRVSLYSTVVSPLMVTMLTPYPENADRIQLKRTLPRARWADYSQLRWSLKLGGMPF